MAFLSSLLDTQNGAGYKAPGLSQPLQQVTPGQVDLTQPGTLGQATGANQQYADALGQAQGGIGQQQAFVNALQGQQGLANQQNVFNQQQGLSNQLQGVANGTGPNPAQAQLAQATGANVSNQAALMAGQRGTGANTGLLARQAAQQGANTQQQAAGQAATLQAQQSLGALGQLQGQQANMANLAAGQVGQQQAGLGQLGALQAQQQSLASGQQGLQYGQLNTQNAQGLNQQQALNQLNLAQAQGVNQANVNVYGQQTAANSAIARGNQAAQSGILSAATGAIGSGLNSLGAAAAMAHGGAVEPRSHVTRHLKGLPFAHGGKVPAMVSPGEIYLSPKKAAEVAKGKASPKSGEHIKGKAKVAGDSLKNDTVSKKLDVGGVVIPRTEVQSGDTKRMANFVARSKKGSLKRAK